MEKRYRNKIIIIIIIIIMLTPQKDVQVLNIWFLFSGSSLLLSFSWFLQTVSSAFELIYLVLNQRLLLMSTPQKTCRCWITVFLFWLFSFVFLFPSHDRLVGLVVKASASRAEGPGFESRLRRHFFGVEPYQ